MKKGVIFLFGLLLCAGNLSLKADEVTFKASAPDAVAMGEQFRLTYTVNAEGQELRAPDMNDFDVLMGPSTSTSRSIQINNGQSSSVFTQVFTYILMPKKEGSFNVAPATIKVKNANYSSNSLVIKVLPQGQSGAGGSSQNSNGSSAPSSSEGIRNEDVFIQMSVSKRNIYEQEGFLVTFKAYTLYETGFENMKFPEFEGFLAQDIELNPQWTLENYNGKNYQSAVLKQTVLYPQRSGKITIGSGKFDAVIRVRTQKQVRSFFDDFFDSYQNVKKEISSTPVTIDVKPLPSGKPASFSGAVGDFMMRSTINSNNVKTNEAVTVTVTINGSGNIKLLKNPEVVFPNDFEIYDPKVNNDKIKTTTSGTNGIKTIEYMAIPRYAGDFEIPAIEFSYFDLKSGEYKTLHSDPFQLHVEKGAGGNDGSSPMVSNFGQQESLKYLGQDIRYIKVSNPNFVSNGEIFFGSFTYVFAYVIIAILFIVFFLIYRKQVKENANIAFVRTKKANKVAIRRLKRAESLLKEHKKEEFYDEILRAVWGYLSDKLNIPQASLTKDNVEFELSKYGVDEVLVADYMDILHTCEFARYAPSQASYAMDSLFKQTVNAIGKMENSINR